MDKPGTIVVCGATGRQGGAVARHLVEQGWQVRGLSRSPGSARARALAERGIDVVRADMSDRASLDRAFAAAYGVYSVQNGLTSGFEAEVTHGMNVAAAAQAARVRHVVYGSAGIGILTGIPSWDAKVAVTERMRQLELPLTVFRPQAFMELMTDRGFYPPVGVWHVMPKLMGSTRVVPWLAVDDLGVIVAGAFADPSRFVGADIPLAADLKSIDECRAAWTKVFGRRPSQLPMPVWAFERIAGKAGKDLPAMWRWLRSGAVPEDTTPTRAIHPAALTVRQWLEAQRESLAASR